MVPCNTIRRCKARAIKTHVVQPQAQAWGGMLAKTLQVTVIAVKKL